MNMLQEDSRMCILSPKFQIMCKTIHKLKPNHAILVEWQSKSDFEETHSLTRAMKNGTRDEPVSYPSTCIPYKANPPTDHFHKIILPEPKQTSYMVIFRICLDSDGLNGCFLSILFRVPKSLQLPSRPKAAQPVSDASSGSGMQIEYTDLGYTRYLQGQCSACEVTATLLQCSGCRLHGYCSKACQRSLWKTHKHMCRFVREARSGQGGNIDIQLEG